MAAKTVVITGIGSIDRKLKRLEPRVQKKVVRQSMRKGLKVVQAEVKVQVPVRTGLTKSAVAVRANKSRKRGTISLAVRISAKKPGLVKYAKGRRFFTPAIVEYGRLGVAPNPFMRRSYEGAGRSARDVALDEIRTGVNREVKTL